METKEIFLNSAGRLRSGWRFTVFFTSFFFTTFFALAIVQTILVMLPLGLTPNSLLFFVTQFGITTVSAVFFGWLFGKLLEELPFRALGCWFTRNWAKDLILGCLIGSLSFGFAALLAMSLGGFSFQFNNFAGSTAILLTMGTTLIIFIMGAAAEELLFRGYMLQTFSRANVVMIGIGITSLLFASGHNSNPNATYFSWINTFLAGIWFSVAYLKTRTLWFPFGAHLMWNWFQGSIFGISVSGLKELTPAPMMKATDHGPVWLTGGDYGVEGGVACTIALIVSTLAIWFLPILKPTDEMLALTSEEKPKFPKLA